MKFIHSRSLLEALTEPSLVNYILWLQGISPEGHMRLKYNVLVAMGVATLF